MFRWTLGKRIDKFERQSNHDTSWMRDMIDASPRADVQAWCCRRSRRLSKALHAVNSHAA